MIPVVNKEVTGKPERSGGFLMFGRKYDEWLKAFTFIAAAPVEACIIGDGKNPIPPPEQATSVFQKAKRGHGQSVLIALIDDDDGEGPKAVVASQREFEVLRLTSPRLKLSPCARSSALSSTEQADSLVALKKYQAAGCWRCKGRASASSQHLRRARLRTRRWMWRALPQAARALPRAAPPSAPPPLPPPPSPPPLPSPPPGARSQSGLSCSRSSPFLSCAATALFARSPRKSSRARIRSSRAKAKCNRNPRT